MSAHSIDPTALLEDLGWVRALARGLVRDEALAEDLVQETWLEAAERKWPGGRPPRAWLATVLRNLFRQEQRSGARRRRREGLVAAEEALPSTAELVERMELQRQLAEEVLRLEEPLRSTLMLRYAKGLEPKEIARRQGVPASTVRGRARRGLEILRERLDAKSGGDRRRWLVGIVPIALEGEGRLSTALVSIGTGGVVMKAVGLAAAAVAAVLLVVVMMNRGGQERPAVDTSFDGASSTGSGATEVGHSEVLPGGACLDAAARVGAPDSPSVEHYVRGRVIDEAGAPAVGERVFVCADEDPFGSNSDLPRFSEASGLVGRILHTDAEGRFEATFPSRRALRLWVSPSIGYRASYDSTDSTRVVDATTPADNVLFVLRSNPTARLDVRVYDAVAGDYLDDFAAWITSEELCCSTKSPSGGTQILEFAMLRGSPEHGRVTLLRPEYASPPERDFVLTSGETTEVVLVVQPKHQLCGPVTDLGGSPIEGALVYFGVLADGRGDEPFKPFRPKRISAGVETDGDGRFELSGDGAMVTVWHPHHQSTTVPSADAFVIELPERGRLHGIWSGDDGAEVRLDKDRRTPITAGGRFTYEHVDAGDHRLVLPDGTSVCVWLDAGEELELDLTDRLESVSMTAVAFGEPYVEAWRGVLVGTSAISSVLEADCSGGPFELNDVLPGSYRAFTMDCRQGTTKITAGSAVIDFGSCRLTVTTTPGRRLSLIPAGVSPIEQIIARRMWTRVDDAGKLQLAPLPAGRYLLRDLNSGEETPVVVEGPGTEVVLE